MTFNDCPVNSVTHSTMIYLRMFGQYRKGRLWYPGSPSQQPAHYLRSMEILDGQVEMIRAERMEEAAEKAKKGSNHGSRPGGSNVVQRTVIRSPADARRAFGS